MSDGETLGNDTVCASGSAGDNFCRLDPDDGVEAAIRARALIVLFVCGAVTAVRPNTASRH